MSVDKETKQNFFDNLVKNYSSIKTRKEQGIKTVKRVSCNLYHNENLIGNIVSYKEDDESDDVSACNFKIEEGVKLIAVKKEKSTFTKEQTKYLLKMIHEFGKDKLEKILRVGKERHIFDDDQTISDLEEEYLRNKKVVFVFTTDGKNSNEKIFKQSIQIIYKKLFQM